MVPHDLCAPDTNRDVIVRYIVDQGTINPAADAQLDVRTHGQDDSPFLKLVLQVRSISTTLKGVSIEPAGDGADGFAAYRIKF